MHAGESRFAIAMFQDEFTQFSFRWRGSELRKDVSILKPRCYGFADRAST
jgi:hypothetical protein